MALIGDRDAGSVHGLLSEDFDWLKLSPDLYVAGMHLLFN